MKRAVVVSGGRDYKDIATVEDTLFWLNPDLVYVGDCPTGLDKFVRNWCDENEVSKKLFRAEWNTHGKAAGPIRNREMIGAASRDIEHICIFVAFPGGKGTKDCTIAAETSGFVVLQVKE